MLFVWHHDRSLIVLMANISHSCKVQCVLLTVDRMKTTCAKAHVVLGTVDC